jgi:NTE family protein
MTAKAEPKGRGCRAPLRSNAIGTSRNDLIARWGAEGPRPHHPPSPPKEPALALAFSGGGFRATLAALGVLRFIADTGLLPQVRYVSSVSGGSIANGLFATQYEQLSRAGFTRTALDRLVIQPFVEHITTASLTLKLIRSAWRLVGPETRTDLLARIFDQWFFDGRTLESLSSQVRFIFNAASVTTGVRFKFEGEVLGDWVMGTASTAGTGVRVAQAAAASAAVPGAFAPFVVKGIDFPGAEGRVQKLLDGGAYDNSGMEAIDSLPGAMIVAMNAGGLFRTGAYGGIPVVRDLQRANSLLYRQSTALRRRDLVERFRAWEQGAEAGRPIPSWGRRGVLFGLATSFTPAAEWGQSRPEHADWTEELAGYATSFAKFPREVTSRLLYRGWWLTGASLATYHRCVLPDELPEWEKLGDG